MLLTKDDALCLLLYTVEKIQGKVGARPGKPDGLGSVHCVVQELFTALMEQFLFA
jgi:hypothetical protein